MYAIILAGGSGSRLWPSSTQEMPKPFLTFSGQHSLLQNTIIRAHNLENLAGIIVVVNEKHLSLLTTQLNSLPEINKNLHKIEIIIERENRDTLCAIALGAHYVKNKYGGDRQILIMPSDHHISNENLFRASVLKAEKLSLQNKVVLFGISPTYPETNYGYIEHHETKVLKFIEKPNEIMAKQYVSLTRYLWNTGMIFAKSQILLSEIQKYANHIFLNTQQLIHEAKIQTSSGYLQIFVNKWMLNDRINMSIDYSVLQKSRNIAVIACDFGWNDVGNWNTLSQSLPKDDNGNNIKGNALLHNVSNCYIESNSKQIAVVGVKDLAIIETTNGILIVNKHDAADVRKIFSQLHHLIGKK